MDKVEIKELALEDIPDYVKVNTIAWQESYKGLIADSILDEVLNNIDNSIQKQITVFNNDKKNRCSQDGMCKLFGHFLCLLFSNRNGACGRAKYREQGRVDSTAGEHFPNDCGRPYHYAGQLF